MSDVARVAGVSAQTVSRVLRDHPHVNAATRARVLAAVEQTGYRRTGLARALVTGRTRTVGVVMLETDFYSSSSMLLGMQAAARAAGYFVSTATTSSLSPESIAAAATRLLDQAVDALVVAVPVHDEAALDHLARGVPTVVVDTMRSSSEVVAVDQVAAGRLATDHLLDLGHRTVWHLSGPESWRDAVGRTTGWREALERAGRDVPPVLYGDWTPASGYQNGLLLGRMEDVTAVFVASDEMAFGVVRALGELGRRVPDDVSLVAMDDIALAAYASPPLTTIRQPFQRLGARAVEHALALVDDPGTVHAPEVLHPELVVRGTTAPPRDLPAPRRGASRSPSS